MKSSILQLFLTLQRNVSFVQKGLFVHYYMHIVFVFSGQLCRLVRQWSGVESPLALIFQATLARHCQTCPKVSCWPHCWSSKLPKRGLFLILHKYKPSASDCQSTAGFYWKRGRCDLWKAVIEDLWKAVIEDLHTSNTVWARLIILQIVIWISLWFCQTQPIYK